MAVTPTTLAVLRTRVRQRAHIENSQVVTDAEINDMLNMSLSMLDDLLIDTYADYKLTTAQLTITQAVDGYNNMTVPNDFCKLRGVDRQVSGNWMTLDNYEFPKRNQFSFPVINFVYGYLDVYYKLQGQQVEIIPAANSQATYRLWYIPQYVPLISDSDTLQPYMDTQAWCEYAVVDVCAKILIKQYLDPSFFLAQKAELKDHIINTAKPRDAGPPKRVQNTRYNRGWLGPGWNSDE